MRECSRVTQLGESTRRIQKTMRHGASYKGDDCVVGERECCTLGVRQRYARDAPRLAYNFPYQEHSALAYAVRTQADLRV
ncbi:hypothetical protein EVAR_50903_1 [Eumeta japonica]|uniref:Uncharacterized protein n=1 Tax=Eumeta variegata TaxID=151549 RepID=A0A4C1Y8M1_EUMVA|nr:hypothetical protein EVAR_50903_1 [Eumeta japonica]